MTFAQIIKNFNAVIMITGKDLNALLNDVVSNNTSIRILDGRTKEVRLVKPDDTMPLGYQMTVFTSQPESENPGARVAFAVFGNYGFVTYSSDPFQILKEVEALKSEYEGNSEIKFSKGIEIKISKDLVKLAKKAFTKHENKIRILFTKDDVDYIQKSTEKKLKTLKKEENFYVTSEGDEYYGLTVDGSFCKAVVKAAEEVADSAIDVAITVKTAMVAMVMAANKARDDIKRVIKSNKK